MIAYYWILSLILSWRLLLIPRAIGPLGDLGVVSLFSVQYKTSISGQYDLSSDDRHDKIHRHRENHHKGGVRHFDLLISKKICTPIE